MKQTAKFLSLAALLSFSAHRPLAARSAPEEMLQPSSASFFSDDKVNLSIEGGLLLWRAYQEDLSSFANGEVQELSPSLQRGFRVSIEPLLPHDDWSLLAQWTRLRNETSNQSCNENRLVPLFSPIETAFLTPYSTKNEWQIRFDLLQVELSRSFFVATALSISPFVGILGTLYEQTSKIKTDLSSSLSPIRAAHINSELFQRFRAFGPRGGARLKCPLAEGFDFLTICGLSVLYGHCRVEAESCSSVCFAAENTDNQTPSQLTDSFFTTRGAADLSLGFEWKKAYMEESWAFGLQLFWDQWIFLSQNALIGIDEQLMASTSRIDHHSGITSRKTGDLTMQGVSVMAGIDF